MESLIDSIKMAKGGDKTQMLSILQKFEPLIKKYSYKLVYEDGKAELELFLIELVHNVNVEDGSFYNDACVVSYINKSFINKYYKLSQDLYMKSIIETCMETEISCEEDFVKVESKIFINEIMKKLSDKQKMVVESIYINDNSQVDIAEKFNISRQAICKTNRRALEILRNEINRKGEKYNV